MDLLSQFAIPARPSTRFYPVKEILMNHARLLALPLFLVALLASAASAQVRTFVASTGSDANPCSRTAPCRTFQAAVNAAAPGAEVVALDSAGFGSNVSITKSISIIGSPGVYAGITVLSPNSDGVDINAGGQDTIILRGLTVINQGGSSTGSGIVLKTGGTLHVEDCVVNGFVNGTGVTTFVQPGSSSLEVKDSIIRGDQIGIEISSAHALIDQVRVEFCSAEGIFAGINSVVTVRNTVASGNGIGFFVSGFAGATAELNIETCVASNNLEGIQGSGSSPGVAVARVSNSTVTKNFVGLVNLGTAPVILSRGNNTVEGNTTNTSGPIGSYTSK
jgi:hypothetical protein